MGQHFRVRKGTFIRRTDGRTRTQAAQADGQPSKLVRRRRRLNGDFRWSREAAEDVIAKIASEGGEGMRGRKMEFLNLAGWPWIGATESFLTEAVLAPPPKRQHL